MVTVKSSSTFEPEMGEYEQLKKSEELIEWLGGLPDGAQLTAIIHDLGNQRDPIPTLVGIHARWEESH